MKNFSSESAHQPRMVESIEFVSNLNGGGGVAHFRGAHFQHIEYAPNVVAINTMLHQSIGNEGLVSHNSERGVKANISPVDTLAQVLKGRGEVVIEGRSHMLQNGQDIIIPANHAHFIKPCGHLVMSLAAM